MFGVHAKQVLYIKYRCFWSTGIFSNGNSKNVERSFKFLPLHFLLNVFEIGSVSVFRLASRNDSCVC